MSKELDVPSGMQVVDVDASEPELKFFTGRFPVIYSRGEVEDLVEKLQEWLEATK